MTLISKKHRQGLNFAVLCTLHGYVLVSIDNDLLTRIISKTAKSVLLSICHPHRYVFRESRGLIHVVHFCAKNRGAASDLLRGGAARRPLAPPHLGCSLPRGSPPGCARQSCCPTHFAAVAIGALVGDTRSPPGLRQAWLRAYTPYLLSTPQMLDVKVSVKYQVPSVKYFFQCIKTNTNNPL